MTISAQHRRRMSVVAASAIAAGAVVSVMLGIYGSQHQPTGRAAFTLGFSNIFAMKVWLGSVAGGLALVQLISALWMYGKLGRPAGRSVRIVHRLSGATAVLVSLPVAYNCLWALGFQSYDTRVLVHSLFGCVFYGAFVTKLLALRAKGGPGWLLPLAGGLLLSALVLVVTTSSLWYFHTTGLPPGGSGY